MSWIEGIGDEVTLTVGVFLVLCVLLAAWISTGIREIPFIGVIIVQFRRRHRARTATENQPVTSVSNGPNESDSVVNNDEEEGVRDQAQENTTKNQNTKPLNENKEETVQIHTNLSASDAQPNVSTSQQDNSSESNESVQADQVHAETTLEEVTSITGTVENVNYSAPVDNVSDILSKTELRQRRLTFLSGKQTGATDVDSVCNRAASSEKKPLTEVPLDTDVDFPQNLPCTEETVSPVTVQSSSEPVGVSISRGDNVPSQADPTENRDISSSSGTSDIRNEQTTENSRNSSALPGQIRVKIKFLNETIRMVSSPATETIGNFRRRHFSRELADSMLVRFIYNGQDLRNDSSTLASYNISDNSVLHCLVTQQRQNDQQHEDNENGFDTGVFMFPLFGLLLCCVWYMRFTYRQFFNVTSTLTLGGMTFLFLAAFVSSLRRPVQHGHIE